MHTKSDTQTGTQDKKEKRLSNQYNTATIRTITSFAGDRKVF
ncbi:hypothetical protein PCIT_a1084 [Pseudoalteromonas citrea]|uniref:Uncharacterized protein n=1 Tax=Pseudoalteromonas citrea TaxID=43655 RepID=A0AAD4ALQ0_9GAMM|nr:hypothetical protein PCIT_a1084 [Pseudoalteromonas citrea]